MNRVFDEEESHKVCKVCDYAIRNEDCPGCGFFAFESFSIREHDAEIRRRTIDECIKTLEESYPYSDDNDVIYGFQCALARLEQMKGEA